MSYGRMGQENQAGTDSTTASESYIENGERQPQVGHECEKKAESPAATQGEHATPSDPFLIQWNGPDDPENPINWSTRRKHGVTLILSFSVVVVTFASSVYSAASLAVAKQFSVSNEVAKLGVTLFLCGYAFGPLVWGPISEQLGRKLPMLLSYFGFVLFSFATATAKDLQTVLICRFFGGLFGCGPLSISGGAMADYCTLEQRGIAIAIYSLATFGGPTFGPILGSFIVDSYLGWRWTEYLTAIVGSAFLVVLVFALPETYAKRILQNRAAKRRRETGQWAWHTQLDLEPFDLQIVLTKYLTRPIVMLVSEPMILLLSIYVAFIYGILYLLFGSLPVHYVSVRGWSSGVGSLPFLALLLGCAIGCLIMVAFNPRYIRMCKANRGLPVPEERLLPMIVGAFLFPIGCFWYAWTTYPSVQWVVPTLALIPVGCGIILLFLQALNYLIDAYLAYANSALAANSLLRSLFGAGFPLFGTQMMVNLGLQWANTLIGLIGVVLMPIPILFYLYGKRLRRSSRFATE